MSRLRHLQNDAAPCGSDPGSATLIKTAASYWASLLAQEASNIIPALERVQEENLFPELYRYTFT
jgi:hypothetical protein